MHRNNSAVVKLQRLRMRTKSNKQNAVLQRHLLRHLRHACSLNGYLQAHLSRWDLPISVTLKRLTIVRLLGRSHFSPENADRMLLRKFDNNPQDYVVSQPTTPVYHLIYIVRFETSGDAFRLPFSIAFDCSIRLLVGIFHLWLYTWCGRKVMRLSTLCTNWQRCFLPLHMAVSLTPTVDSVQEWTCCSYYAIVESVWSEVVFVRCVTKMDRQSLSKVVPSNFV